MIMEALRDKHADGSVRSTIQLRPEVKWLHLDDTDDGIETFYEESEEIIGLANDGRGMNAVEKLRCLGQCLKRSRLKVNKVVIDESRLLRQAERGSRSSVRRGARAVHGIQVRLARAAESA